MALSATRLTGLVIKAAVNTVSLLTDPKVSSFMNLALTVIFPRVSPGRLEGTLKAAFPSLLVVLTSSIWR